MQIVKDRELARMLLTRLDTDQNDHVGLAEWENFWNTLAVEITADRMLELLDQVSQADNIYPLCTCTGMITKCAHTWIYIWF